MVEEIGDYDECFPSFGGKVLVGENLKKVILHSLISLIRIKVTI